MTTSLTLRNLTNVAFDLKQVELSGQPVLDDHDQYSTPIDPFAEKRIDISLGQLTLGLTNLRLTFVADGQEYYADLLGHQKKSVKLLPAHQPPRHEFTAIFHPHDDAHLSIFSSSSLCCWMKELPSSTSLTALSIPGIHNTATCYRALPSVRCQAVSPQVQLANGVRFFDIRVQPASSHDPRDDNLILVHGVFPISLTGAKYFRDLLNATLNFLDENPSETVIMSIKREGYGQATDQQLSRILHEHYVSKSDRWYTKPVVPSLGEARSKIVLMRRFALDDSLATLYGGRGYGINAQRWRYNCNHDTHGDVCVQDYSAVNETTHIDEKIRYATEHLARAGIRQGSLPGGKLYLNFLSGSNFWKMGCWPDRIAKRINPEVVSYLCRTHAKAEGAGGTGVVVCDFVGDGDDWDLVRCIVGMNARLQVTSQPS